MSINRVNALGASFVCSVLKTRCGQRTRECDLGGFQVADFRRPLMTFGSWRKMWRKPSQTSGRCRAHRDLVDAFW